MHGRRLTLPDFEGLPIDKLVIRRIPLAEELGRHVLFPWIVMCTNCRLAGRRGYVTTTSFDGPHGIVGAAQRHALTVHRVVL